MSKKHNMVAMLLAGGQGSRLKSLTSNTAKPAVPFGGKYKIIDFAISNAANSGIDNIGILTQYKHFYLNEHIGLGQAWDYDRLKGGLKILSPYFTEKGGRWYKGTANAIYENIDYLDNISPDYVLILSGDHIYKMDYDKMLKHHIQNKSDVTIAVMEVDWQEASRFGIMNTDENDYIIEFEEKPKKPKSNLASMGIYIFTWDVLRKALIEDYKKENSTYDFGKDIIPELLSENKKMSAYRFNGYWKDVGTVRSYWEANLDLIKSDNELDIYDTSWRIHTTSKNLPPHFIGKDASVSNTLVNEACQVLGSVTNSVLFDQVTIEDGAKVCNSVLLPGVIVKSGAKVFNAVINNDIEISEDTVIGELNSDKVYLVSEDGISEE
ncbi:glucose-1-phosphate adenylyltransferase [Helcococcus ovis]|uniref:Glucose-1-phosphate adenylyltransferase n=2 Tax=Bacteria TaxID=2 RepID=A0A4R9BZU5_9FIRM|nr:glucose-1-phosphate adenylyltransferase [Helcococcus ovis]TFF64040.1 glucose-1-phosphate adenylyltransferase [Helcococcus ovis]TFF64632.1 glucose-1-phosphate adenylyltransferase [Helcococcus ovis]TFF68418.1 glucose-1-phosphate adenylyltransferase [Helcococcus ovis]WNZ00473.1 glucose-1-phosphate adenylyltransferase [Helcococcus ovis]